MTAQDILKMIEEVDPSDRCGHIEFCVYKTGFEGMA